MAASIGNHTTTMPSGAEEHRILCGVLSNRNVMRLHEILQVRALSGAGSITHPGGIRFPNASRS